MILNSYRKQTSLLSMIVMMMMMMAFCITLSHQQKLSAQECENLGYKSSELACSTCKEFSLFMSEKSIIENCNQCCQESISTDNSLNSQSSDEKEFVSGTLYFCYCNIRSFPEIEGFINNDVKKFNHLNTAQRQAIMPTLTMKRKDGSEESHLVSHWKVDEIKEFLNEKLKQ